MAVLEPTMTVPELAQRLGIDASTVYRYLRGDKLPGVRVGSGWIIDRQRVERFIAGREDAQGHPLIQDVPLAQQSTQDLVPARESVASELGMTWPRGALAALEILVTSLEQLAAAEADQRQSIST